jgi:hypothetical protein
MTKDLHNGHIDRAYIGQARTFRGKDSCLGGNRVRLARVQSAYATRAIGFAARRYSAGGPISRCIDFRSYAASVASHSSPDGVADFAVRFLPTSMATSNFGFHKWVVQISTMLQLD